MLQVQVRVPVRTLNLSNVSSTLLENPVVSVITIMHNIHSQNAQRTCSGVQTTFVCPKLIYVMHQMTVVMVQMNGCLAVSIH